MIVKRVAVASIPDVAEATGEAVIKEPSLNAYTHFCHLILDKVIPRDWVWRGNQGTDTARHVVTGPIDLIPSSFPIPGSSLQLLFTSHAALLLDDHVPDIILFDDSTTVISKRFSVPLLLSWIHR